MLSILFQSLYGVTRCLAILLLIIYALTSSGATVYYHECGQRSQLSLSDNNTTHKTCQFCTEKEKKHKKEHHCHDHSSCDISGDCCKDVQIELKNSEEQLTSTNFIKEFNAVSPVEITLHWIILSWVEAEHAYKGQYALDFAPPLSLPNTYLVNCNFRI